MKPTLSRLASAMAFHFASTNLVFELGIVLWLFIGWRFTLAEFVGGLVLITVMWIALRLLVTREREEEIRRFTVGADAGHVHPTASSELPLRRKVVSLKAWSDVAYNFRGDWQMLWKEIGAGFLIAGTSRSSRPASSTGSSRTPRRSVRIAENVVVGPIVASLAFVCSIGNVPLAAVLWAGGISFSGSSRSSLPTSSSSDRRVLPKGVRPRFTRLLVAIMFFLLVAAALAVDGFSRSSACAVAPSVGRVDRRASRHV
jgi:hypothetical protein